MNENSSQTIKELSEDQEIKNSSELDNDTASQNEEDLSFEKSDIPSADSSSSRTNTDFDNAGFTQEEFASLLGKYDYNFKPGDLVKGIKPYGAFIDIGGVSGLLHISEISHEHIETPHNVLNVNDQMKVMIIDLDSERGRISLSTKALEPEPGDMLSDPQKVFSKAEEMAAKYKQMLFEQTDDNEEIPTASAGTV